MVGWSLNKTGWKQFLVDYNDFNPCVCFENRVYIQATLSRKIIVFSFKEWNGEFMLCITRCSFNILCKMFNWFLGKISKRWSSVDKVVDSDSKVMYSISIYISFLGTRTLRKIKIRWVCLAHITLYFMWESGYVSHVWHISRNIA